MNAALQSGSAPSHISLFPPTLINGALDGPFGSTANKANQNFHCLFTFYIHMLFKDLRKCRWSFHTRTWTGSFDVFAGGKEGRR